MNNPFIEAGLCIFIGLCFPIVIVGFVVMAIGECLSLTEV